MYNQGLQGIKGVKAWLYSESWLRKAGRRKKQMYKTLQKEFTVADSVAFMRGKCQLLPYYEFDN